MEKINFEVVSFEIIGLVGEAKYLAVEAFNQALKTGNYAESFKMIEDAEKKINEAGAKHMDVIVAEANGVKHEFSVLFMHAEDQFLSTQTFVLTSKMMIQMLEASKK